MSEERPETPTAPAPKEVQAMASWLARATWFALGVTVGIAGTVAVNRATRTNAAIDPRPRAGYESLPLADNSGVCQEFVAIASLRTTYADASATARRLSATLPPPLRPEHLRVVRAIAPGEHWTLALDNQAGAGQLEEAQRVAAIANQMAGTGVRWTALFYGARELYDAAGVLCFARQSAGADAGR
ncbi:MAG: hypothetical protein JNK05_29445 [Myxococcales bacterium]|nr:hypothetical protein [Myxococcales bacterium]